MSRTVVIHADHLDPVALRAMATGVPAMHIDELIPVMEGQPWPEVLRLSPGAHLEHLFRGANVVNRVFSLEGTQVERFLAEHGVDARWFHIRLQPLLALGVSLCHDTGTRGVSRCLAPLNVQWFELERALPEANTPDFAYSFGYEEPDLSRIEDPMQKSVWSLFDWRQERQLDDEERRRHQFHVSRPKGVPVIAWFLGRDYNGIHFPRGSVEVDDAVCGQLTRAAAHAFRSEAGEMLLYVTDEAVTFHAFSPYLRSVAADAAAQDALDAWLLAGNAGGVNAA